MKTLKYFALAAFVQVGATNATLGEPESIIRRYHALNLCLLGAIALNNPQATLMPLAAAGLTHSSIITLWYLFGGDNIDDTLRFSYMLASIVLFSATFYAAYTTHFFNPNFQ